MPCCVVPGCTSGYKTNLEKVQFFTVPKDDELRNKWQIALKRPNALVAKSQIVCSKHFLSNDIIRVRRLLSPEGVVVGVSPYERPRLAVGAVPSLFPWTEVIPSNNETENIREPICEILEVNVSSKICLDTERQANNLNSTEDEVKESSKICLDTERQENNLNSIEDEVNESPKICLHIEKQENITNNLNSIEDFNFTNLLNSTMTLPLLWMRNTIVHNRKTLISFSVQTCEMTNGNYYSFNLKEVIVDSTLQLHAHVLENPLITSSFITVKNSITSVEDLQLYLRQLNGLKVCRGCMILDIQDHEKSDVMYSDKRNVIRHKTCTLLCRSLQCYLCQNAKRALLRKRKRHEINLQGKQSQDQNSRVPENLVKAERMCVNQLKRKLNRSIKQNKKLRLMNVQLRKDLKISQNKMAIASEDHVLTQLRSNEVTKNQCDVVHEILKASHCKTSSGRRYSENWLMLCMLLFLRSVSGYNFIRDNNILPLPCVGTMRRNLSIITKQCGFDSEFFESFSNFLSEKEEIHKHGLLLLDKISCRESINICSENLTFVGLEDFGEEGNKLIAKNDKANNRFVLMFQPLYDTYTQHVAVFDSQGPVNGQVLSQLIVKAIILLEKSGAKIHGVITDGAATSRKFWSILGMSGQNENFKNYFRHPCEADRKIFVFSDTPHLIKTIRNRLYSIGSLQIDPDKPRIEWQHFKDMYEKDSQFSSELRMCPKINNQHLVLNRSSKMKVRLAAEIFSQSVADALQRYAANDSQLHCWESTAEFCSWMSLMFDALNRRESRGVLPDSEDFKVLELSLQKLNDWEENLNKKRIPETAFLTTQTAEGLRITLQSSIDIIRLLTEKLDFPAVRMGRISRINQDSLEVQSSPLPRHFVRQNDCLTSAVSSIMLV